MTDHVMDTQAEAFRDAGPEDWLTDDDLAAMHERGELIDVTGEPIKTVELHEAECWDAARLGTKDFATAREELALRVVDPSAPDDDPTAYDQLDPASYPGSA